MRKPFLLLLCGLILCVSCLASDDGMLRARDKHLRMNRNHHKNDEDSQANVASSDTPPLGLILGGGACFLLLVCLGYLLHKRCRKRKLKPQAAIKIKRLPFAKRITGPIRRWWLRRKYPVRLPKELERQGVGSKEELVSWLRGESELEKGWDPSANRIRLCGLSLTDNDVKDIANALVATNKDISVLDISENGISDFGCRLVFGAIAENSNLRLTVHTLILNGNRIEELPLPQFIDYSLLESLKELHVADNLLKFIPSAILHAVGLDRIDTTNNPLRTAEGGDFDGRTRIEAHVAEVGFTKVRTLEVGEALEELELDSDLPLQLWLLGGGISSSDFDAISRGIEETTRPVTVITINDNKLGNKGVLSMMKAICRNPSVFENLTSLAFNGSQISKLPTAHDVNYGKLEVLESFSVAANKLGKLPSELAECPLLEFLCFDGNPMEKKGPGSIIGRDECKQYLKRHR